MRTWYGDGEGRAHTHIGELHDCGSLELHVLALDLASDFFIGLSDELCLVALVCPQTSNKVLEGSLPHCGRTRRVELIACSIVRNKASVVIKPRRVPTVVLVHCVLLLCVLWQPLLEEADITTARRCAQVDK